MIKNERVTPYLLFVIVIVGVFMLTLWPTFVQAGPILPPRDTPGPGPQGDKDDDGDKGRDKPVGAYIELQTQMASAGAWSVVQWQDSAGGWHDVEGWRGPLSDGANRLWWVAARDFGKGSFHWAVTQGPGGPLVGVSAPFNLPGGGNETVLVTVGQ